MTNSIVTTSLPNRVTLLFIMFQGHKIIIIKSDSNVKVNTKVNVYFKTLKILRTFSMNTCINMYGKVYVFFVFFEVATYRVYSCYIQGLLSLHTGFVVAIYRVCCCYIRCLLLLYK